MIGIEIDLWSNSIVEVDTGVTFETSLKKSSLENLALINNDWLFDWNKEIRANTVYQLLVKENLTEIQGLISLGMRFK